MIRFFDYIRHIIGREYCINTSRKFPIYRGIEERVEKLQVSRSDNYNMWSNKYNLRKIALSH